MDAIANAIEPEQEPQLLTTQDVAKALGRSRRWVGYLTEDGRLPEPRFDGKRNVWDAAEITPEILEAALRRRPQFERAAAIAAKQAAAAEAAG